MKLKYLFIGLIFVRCLFLALPNTMISPFLFPSEEMKSVTAYTYAFLFIESLSFFIIIGLLVLVGTNHYKLTWERTKSIIAYLYMVGLDLIDFVVRANSEWFYLGSYPVTNNVFILGAYFLLTFNTEE